MTRVFADACYWIALLNRKDQLHGAAIAVQKDLKNSQIVTTDEVLVEVLNFFSCYGLEIRSAAVQCVEALRADAHVTVVEQSRITFDSGLRSYKQSGDKKWSLTDCVSFELMRRDGMSEALTNDHHFEQAGFVVTLREQ